MPAFDKVTLATLYQMSDPAKSFTCSSSQRPDVNSWIATEPTHERFEPSSICRGKASTMDPWDGNRDTSHWSCELAGSSSCSFPDSSALGILLTVGKCLKFAFCLLRQGSWSFLNLPWDRQSRCLTPGWLFSDGQTIAFSSVFLPQGNKESPTNGRRL